MLSTPVKEISNGEKQIEEMYSLGRRTDKKWPMILVQLWVLTRTLGLNGRVGQGAGSIHN